MTTAIKRVFAQAFVPGAAALVGQRLGKRVLSRCPFPPRGPSTLRLHLGAQLLWALCALTEAQAAALPVLDFGTLRAPGARSTRRSWPRDRLATDHGDARASRTGPLPPPHVQRAIIFGQKWATGRPRTGKNVPAVRRPWGPPRAGHGPQVDSELEQAGGVLPLCSPPRPQALAHGPGGPPLPACRCAPAPPHRAPGSQGRWSRCSGGRGAGPEPRARGGDPAPQVACGVGLQALPAALAPCPGAPAGPWGPSPPSGEVPAPRGAVGAAARWATVPPRPAPPAGRAPGRGAGPRRASARP